MHARTDFHESHLLALLDVRRPELLEPRRFVALDMLQYIPDYRLCRMLTPTLASALLETTRLGALELELVEGLWSDEEYERLSRVRRILAAAMCTDEGGGVSALLPSGDRWYPLFLSQTLSPWPRLGSLALTLDHGRQRVDALAEEMRELVALHGGSPERLFVARTRFGPRTDSLPKGAAFGVAAALQVARRKADGPMPRWGAVPAGAPRVHIETLPPDVRLLVVHEDAWPPAAETGWEVALGGPREEALGAWRSGESVCFVVDSPRMAADCVLAVQGVRRARSSRDRVREAPTTAAGPSARRPAASNRAVL